MNNPNVGPLTALLTAFLSAVLGVLDAFNVFHASAAQQGAIATLAIALVALGLYIYSVLQSWHVINIQKLVAQQRLANNMADRQVPGVPPSVQSH